MAYIAFSTHTIVKNEAERDERAEENAAKAHKARMETNKHIEEINEEYQEIGDRLTPVDDN